MTSEVMAPGGAIEISENSFHRIESVRAVNIQVECETHLHADEQIKPEYLASIEITGRPAAIGFTARSALICFYPDGHAAICKPSYDELKRQIKINYPMSMFEAQVEILSGHCEVECTYLESVELAQGDAYLQGIGCMPEQLH